MAAVFIGGRFETSADWQIKELAEEIGEVGVYKSRHPYIFVDENESEIDTEAPTPLQIVQQKAYEQARKDILEEQKRALNSEGNISNSESKDFAASLGNSNTISEIVDPVKAGAKTVDVSTSTGAKLADLKSLVIPK